MQLECGQDRVYNCLQLGVLRIFRTLPPQLVATFWRRAKRACFRHSRNGISKFKCGDILTAQLKLELSNEVQIGTSWPPKYCVILWRNVRGTTHRPFNCNSEDSLTGRIPIKIACDAKEMPFARLHDYR
jgi:hypothetical protein